MTLLLSYLQNYFIIKLSTNDFIKLSTNDFIIKLSTKWLYY